jgi:ATP-dependent DNA ligase
MDSGIYNIFEELRSSNSGNFKLETLKKHKDNTLLTKVFEATYSPFVQYYIKQLPDTMYMTHYTAPITLEYAIDQLEVLSARQVSGNAAKDHVAQLLINLTPEDADVLRCILDRSIGAGLSAKTVNKVWDNLIPEIPYMRCEKLSDKSKKNIKYPAVVQLKADGTFFNIIKHKKQVYCMTRNGSQFWIDKVTEYFERVLTDVDNIVITGEGVIFVDGTPLVRKIGNGRINSYIKREEVRERSIESQKEMVLKGKGSTKGFTKLVEDLKEKEIDWAFTESNMIIEAWDMIDFNDWVDGKSNVPYMSRFNRLKELIKDCPFITAIDSREVNSFDEAMDYANEMMAKGLEGGVLKDANAIWENKTSKYQIKLKAELDADLIVVGYSPGEGEFEGGIGALTCRTSDGLLEVSVGSGLSRDQRGLQRVDEADMTKGLMLREDLISIDDFFNREYKEKIVAVLYNEVISSGGKDTYSLFLPRFVEVRYDKDEADTLERLKG